MRCGDTIVLDHAATAMDDPHGLILGMAAGRRVLNVGAAGNASYYRDHGTDGWLHARMAKVAASLTGLDLNTVEVGVASGLGYEVVAGNCENVDLGQSFDLIVMADVLEHVDSPAAALANMMRHLPQGGKIIVTSPNATFLGNVLNALLRRGPNVYWDHVNLFTPENIQALCDRHGWMLAQTAMYSLVDSRSALLRLKCALIGATGQLFPRLHSAFLCVIAPREECQKS